MCPFWVCSLVFLTQPCIPEAHQPAAGRADCGYPAVPDACPSLLLCVGTLVFPAEFMGLPLWYGCRLPLLHSPSFSWGWGSNLCLVFQCGQSFLPRVFLASKLGLPSFLTKKVATAMSVLICPGVCCLLFSFSLALLTARRQFPCPRI